MDKLIKQIRLAAQMNQEQFANALGTTPLSVNRWENGKTMPNNMAQLQLFEFCRTHNIDLFEYIVNNVKYKEVDSFYWDVKGVKLSNICSDCRKSMSKKYQEKRLRTKGY